MSNNILVFIEQREGVILPASFQLLALANDLTGKSGGQAEACVVGEGVGNLTDKIAAQGAKKIYTVDDPELKMYRVVPYTAALCAVIDEADPKTVLIPTTFMGRDLASRVAARKRAALAIDCMEVVLDGDDLVVSRGMYAGKFMGKVRLAKDKLQIATVRSNAYSALDPQDGASADVQAVSAVFTDADKRAKIKEIVSTTSGIKDVTEADIIVAGGRALKSEDNFKIIIEMAELLDGAVGASRAACDSGYQPHSRQVGLTGKVVTPRLYIACGIDGAIQHLAGMRGSKVIVGINTKKDAPIYSVATYGCVADLFEIVPLLTQELKRLAG
ncbi:MAG: electron transfer flavoprotein subunit alpha/FixB family protein [Phycisphaerales bacterium]|nr:MAG: electron transfer flavoprotein subunit alpha/FixB family protein [Phycisphaerales bacterium]